MSDQPSEAPHTLWRNSTGSQADSAAKAASVAALRSHDDEQGVGLPEQLFAQLPFAVYVCDRSGLVLRYNREAARLWGRSPKLGDPNERFCGSYRMFRPDGTLLPHHECPMAEVLRTGISVRQQEVHIEQPNGLRGIALVDIEALKDSDGNIVGAVNCFQDITERKHGEEAALRLAAIVESSDDAIISKNLDGVITSWNKGAQRIFGYLAEEVIGKPGTILIPPERLEEEPAILERIRHGERVDHYETVRKHKDGSLIDISLTVSPVRGVGGKIVGASKIARNISDRKRSEAQIAVLAREAEHRAKNVLATVQAAVRLSRADTPEALKRVIEGRIQALANVHRLFVETRWVGADVGDIIAQELSPYCREGDGRARIEGPHLTVEPSVAQVIAVTVHELSTNAAKYGALSLAAGYIHVEWSLAADDRFLLRWTENNGPRTQPPASRGFGMRVMESMITAQSKGEVSFAWQPDGLICEITLPASSGLANARPSETK